ncbi:MAG: serine acetyltransferase [bacterium]|nr:serine acetyltransferase [bacterium]
MSSKSLQQVCAATAASLSVGREDALAKADDEGYPDWVKAVVWVEHLKGIILHERDEETLRTEVPAIAKGLRELLADVRKEEGFDPDAVVTAFIRCLPEVRARLAEDIEAAFEGDPAAKSFGEIIVAYPSIHAIAIYRLAHELVLLGVPQLPRIVTEHAHARTGIDIHPGARIGRRLFIDHGTGVVIGESSEIGDDVRLYHGVTLGAFSPRRGQTLRGTKRHPTIGDNVTIYPCATILGGETVIGSGSVVNGNAYLTESVPPNSRVIPEAPHQEVRQRSGRETRPGQLHWDI